MKTLRKIVSNISEADNKIKKVLFGIMLAALSCSIWHNYIKIFDIGELFGYEAPTATVPLNLKSWFSAEYQQKVEENVVLSNLLSPFFIRVSHQIDHSIFGKLEIPSVIFGKDMQLYQEAYLISHSGLDYIGEEKLRDYVQKMKFVQDTLEKQNKVFIYIQAPGKACYFPETLPEGYSVEEAEFNNYKSLKKLLIEYNINHIDFKPYMLDNKATTPYPFFPRTGVHWTRYAICTALDSINHYIESTTKLDLPEAYWDDIELSHAKFDDADLECMANLLFRLKDDIYAYPEMKFEAAENKDTPKLLMIGDSYLGNFYHSGFFNSYSSKSQFWFYNSSIFSPSYGDKIHRYQLNQFEVLNNSEVVILGCNEPNIRSMSWGFINDTYDYFKNGTTIPALRIAHMKRVDSCVNATEYFDMEALDKFCKKQNVSIDSAKILNCMWKLNRNKML